jgi:hypothetical protein
VSATASSKRGSNERSIMSAAEHTLQQIHGKASAGPQNPARPSHRMRPADPQPSPPARGHSRWSWPLLHADQAFLPIRQQDKSRVTTQPDNSRPAAPAVSFSSGATGLVFTRRPHRSSNPESACGYSSCGVRKWALV